MGNIQQYLLNVHAWKTINLTNNRNPSSLLKTVSVEITKRKMGLLRYYFQLVF